MADVGRNEHNGDVEADPRRGEGVERDPRRRPQRQVRIDRERRLAAKAARQHGVIGRDQLLDMGYERGAIAHRLRSGRLRQVHTSVYAVGSHPLNQTGRWYAALLATRPDPVLSHLSSAAKRGLASERDGMHVTTVRRSVRNLAGVTVHRSRRLDPLDVERLDDIPCTTLPRTLLDLAETEPLDRLKTIAEAAERRDLLDLRAIGACLARNAGRRGIAPLSRLLAEYEPVGKANEGLETSFSGFVTEYGLPEPLRNVLVAGLLVDVWWPQAKLVVELDSRKHHGHWTAAVRDGERDAKLMRLDIHTLRVTDRRLRLDRARLFGDIATRFATAGEPLTPWAFR